MDLPSFPALPGQDPATSPIERLRARLGFLLPLAVIIGINLVAFGAMLLAGGSFDGSEGGELLAQGGIFETAIDDRGESWRIFTSAFLHVGWPHLAGNLVALVFLSILLGLSIGGLRFVLVYMVSILSSAYAVLLFDGDALTVGASGAIFGLAGAGLLVAIRKRNYLALLLVGIWMISGILMSFAAPEISLSGHLGGLVGGMLMGALLVGDERGLRKTPLMVALSVGLMLFLFQACLYLA